ncbi:GNAT family N-acetyltransferase [Actinotalea sp. BY-33]|uniref:GNAT family N-acetyltransferase n=1 Tax=Actinotalea soli TaxID=2819234 RepID=A0A939RUX8_9CELL|nr:GNAT family protein [Actinotalea soli]MBO1753144.1 GNAT family N-acetyltransferase [Actinotalea soli]
MHHDLTLHAADLRLAPLAEDHAPALLDLVDDELWAGMTSPTPRTVQEMTTWVHAARTTPQRYAFAVLGPDGTTRGSTSFYEVDERVARCEIGHTFYGRAWWGGSTNPAAKLALLTHAFDVWGMHRVALRADARNSRSIAAMRRLGATAEGVLRGHRIAADGTRGDTAYFSVLAEEWPGVREGLLERLGSAPAPG